MDGWLRLRGWARIGVLVSRLRLMVDQVLASRIDFPAGDRDVDRAATAAQQMHDQVLDLVRRLVELNGLDQ